ncbi:Wzz/FepE/Etk N-terminal domain-containing protein [Rheinheimera faecalis]
MAEYSENVELKGIDDSYEARKAVEEIDLIEVLLPIWRNKYYVLIITLAFMILSVFYALSLPNIYRSEAVLVPSEQKANGLSGQLGGLAALAGVNVGGASAADKTSLALEILKSRYFISRFIDKHDLYADLMAVKSWEKKTNSIYYNSAVYDSNTSKWIGGDGNSRPSIQKAYEEFNRVFSVSVEPANNVYKISINHLSPFVSQHWVNLLIKDINEEMRSRDIADSEKSIAYLENRITETNVSDLKVSLYSLIEEQTKTLMLANVRDEYVFKVIDPAIAPEKRFSPSRSIIVILSSFIGLLLSSVLFVLTSLFKRGFGSAGR